MHIEAPGTRLRRNYILACANDAAQRLTRPIGHLNIVIIGDRKMAHLHKKFMYISGATDVLTFDLTATQSRELDGDIYISLDQARRQAKHYGVRLNEEIARLAVHGILHLAGFRDESVKEKKQMRRLEELTLSTAGSLNDH